jgi:zinc/manganese transport system substrate-binding protein
MLRVVLSFGLVASLAAGCGSDDGDDGGAGDGRPTVVVTSTILGDVVGEVAGDDATVEVLLPIGADPHDFAPSTRQAEAMADADLLVVNGLGFEEGLDDAIEQAAGAGATVFTATDHIEPIGDDPHFWTDPTRMVPVVAALADALVDAGLDPAGVEDRADEYAASLEAVDAESEEALADVPADRRALVTNHEVLAYFADRYDFEVLGAVVPSLSTGAEPSAADVDDLAGIIEDAGVPAIFAETSNPADLAEALAASVGDVEVVELHTESLSEPDGGAATYLDMLRSNVDLIAGALAG